MVAQSQIFAARTSIHHAKHVLVFSGAGLSKASGIATYRDEGGLWTEQSNLRFSHVNGMRSDPGGFEAFWEARLKQLNAARPNAAHEALARLQGSRPNTLLVTQNIDGLLQAAGCTDVIELHGSALGRRCKGCARRGPFLMDRCVRCGGKLRPDVVLFGENLDSERVNLVMESLPTVDLVLIVGSTLEVYPAALIPERAKVWGAKLILVDPAPPAHWRDAVDICIELSAEDVLPELF